MNFGAVAGGELALSLTQSPSNLVGQPLEMEMRQFLHHAAATFGLLIMVLLAGTGAASAQGNETRVIVPDVPGGAIVSGCYEAASRLYTHYRFSFCLEQRGTYTVRGGGVRCDGRLSWSAKGATVSAELKRTSCGNGVAWSADSFTCRPDLLLGILGLIVNPDRPFLSALRCNYVPQAGTGHKPVSFVARRIN